MRIHHSFSFVITLVLLVFNTSLAQTVNFDETWKEFLENDKISNMSALGKPDKVYKPQAYTKYLLMNTNTNFCQSKIPKAEELMAEVQSIDAVVYKSIPGFVGKMDQLKARMDAYHSMDAIWQQFLRTQSVTLEELEAIEAAQTSCEKQTLAKYSYMKAYQYFCQDEIATAMNIFENRTLRLTEKTTLRVSDVKGLGTEVAKMKTLFKGISELNVAWRTYIETGNSPGFDIELPFFPCNPTPNMQALILRGAADLCGSGSLALEKIKSLQAETGVRLSREITNQINALEEKIGQDATNLAALNEAWEAFIPDNKVKHMGRYGYEYCSQEALIRAYIMDGFAYVCEMATDMLERIDELQRTNPVPLATITQTKIDELKLLNSDYQAYGRELESVWNNFVAQGDVLPYQYESADFYCDNIHQVKDWTMRGLSGTCEEGLLYLEQIDDFQRRFEFNFVTDLECRVQKLRIKVWDCRHEALQKLARVEVVPEEYENRLAELIEEYDIGERPAVCEFE